MGAAEDDDIQLQRASGYLLSHLKSSLPNLLWKQSPQDPARRKVHRWAHPRAIDRIISYIEPFQEDPQLLDTSLKLIVPWLVTAYLEYLPVAPTGVSKPGFETLQHAICRLLYQLCKARGEKIIVSLLNNEPRYLEPILKAFEASTNPPSGDTGGHPAIVATWEEKYVLLLWLSHLMLAPFDLASISSQSLAVEKTTIISLPKDTPGIAAHIVPMCVRNMQSASKERNAAALLMVRLCLRPDMRKIGLLSSVVRWALIQNKSLSTEELEIHRYLGILSFLSRLVASATTDEIGSFIPTIYSMCQMIVHTEPFRLVRASAIVRKFVIKIFRNLVTLCLQWDSAVTDTTAMLEEVVDYLIAALADTDTPVRYAASKALSIITLKLDTEMAVEIIDAVLESYEQDVFNDGGSRNVSSVDPLRWHGLTLTLGQVLYRRVPRAEQFPKLINALLMALSFEQRSTTGASIGTNVRDAACFGVWAMSRRYTTVELASIDTKEIQSIAQRYRSLGVEIGTTQMLAVELLVASCLDPAGNIRRGSSAALQELVGRHPDTIAQGIALVQTVDYHAVALRSRAIEDVALNAANLYHLYLECLMEGAQGWRGIRAVDASSRQSAAALIGALTALEQYLTVTDLIYSLIERLKRLPFREIEERHGLIFSLSAITTRSIPRFRKEYAERRPIGVDGMTPLRFLQMFFNLWKHLKDDFGIQASHFTDMSLRPELTALAFCASISALSQHSVFLKQETPIDMIRIPMEWILETLKLCMRRTEDSVLNVIPDTVHNFSLLLSERERVKLVESWLRVLQASPNASSRPAGLMLALGTISTNLTPGIPAQMSIIHALTKRCTTEFKVETRVVALQALQRHLSAKQEGKARNVPDFERISAERSDAIGTALFTALNDYTITERGDIGSLVRTEALNTAKTAWDINMLRGENDFGIAATVVRLSLEKLDKVRSLAASVLLCGPFASVYDSNRFVDVSSYEYFRHILDVFSKSKDSWFRIAALEGLVSSVGMGSESVVQASRQALADHVESCTTENAYQAICGGLLDVFATHLGNDRITLPVLEVLAFLFDAGIMTDPRNEEFKWRKLLSLVQKTHFKSTVLQKLHLAIDVYRGLAEVPATRTDVFTKLCSMLLHPFPKVRVAAAETLFVVTGVDALAVNDWSKDPKVLKSAAEKVKDQLASL